MKISSQESVSALAGEYFAPDGLYEHTKSLPFLGSLTCNAHQLVAGQCAEVVIVFTVGASGLADGAWIKGTFKFYSDWALFQTSQPATDNYVSAEYVAGPLLPGQTPATVQSLGVRFDQKGHERPFQKAIIIDVVDGYLNPGDRIIVRLGDRRFGAPNGTRVQTFVEDDWRMRWYIDPVGTSRFAAIKPDISLKIVPGEIAKIKVITPRVVRAGVKFRVYVHCEDTWGNATVNRPALRGVLLITDEATDNVIVLGRIDLKFASEGWTSAMAEFDIPYDGHYRARATILGASGETVLHQDEYISVDRSLPVPRLLYADLHVHSDDTVGTNSTDYNFSYARQIAGLDIVGYTANDFHITAERWRTAVETIKQTNEPGKFVVFPGTEWCGNSAAGGDHNVVFLDDPDTNPPEFPLDRQGNVARSFEWNEHGPAELTPGAWPLDELYATYAHNLEGHLLIPHVGGRRCNLAWHHPGLERLLEIGSAWGHFEWLLRDAIVRGWKMGVCANSDEHRGRCGGGISGSGVFGTKGGLTGVFAETLDRATVSRALRARHTFATTGERLAGLVTAENGLLQGDEIHAKAGENVALQYKFWGAKGFRSIEAHKATGLVLQRNMQAETSQLISDQARNVKKLVIRWGGARLYDRYREAIWQGTITIRGSKIKSFAPFGGILDVPEDYVRGSMESDPDTNLKFSSRTSGDSDGVVIFLDDADAAALEGIDFVCDIGGYVKVGDPLRGNAHKAQPRVELHASRDELSVENGVAEKVKGGVEMFVQAELVSDVQLPHFVSGQLVLEGKEKGETSAIYFVGREWDGVKVITSPVFIDFNCED
jgi:hypothetical protein